jgi:hypothetical protein
MKNITLSIIIFLLTHCLNAQLENSANYSIDYCFKVKPNGYYLYETNINPYSPTLKFYFCIADTSDVEFKIFDSEDETKMVLFGRHNLFPGFYILDWNGKENNKNTLLTGKFILEIMAYTSANKTTYSYFKGRTKILLLK